MSSPFRSSGIRVRRRWLVAGAFGIGAVVLFFLLPGGRGAALRLVAAGPGGRYGEDVRIPREWSDTSSLVAGAVVRVPLILAVQNRGGERIQPTKLEISLPSRFRLVHTDGRPLQGRIAPGSPLVRYELPTWIPPLEPGGRPVPLPELDTLWLEPLIPAFYCVALADSVPEFVPAPPPPVEAIAKVQIFYSFEGEELAGRQTGILTVRLDPALLKHEAPEPPPLYPAAYREPEAPIPGFYALRYVGSRHSYCGEPEYPIEILSTLWETPEGGRFIVLDHGGAPRKYLFDLDRDSIIELEVWDPDGDGQFEAWRPARLPIPAFLLPPPPPPPYDLAFLEAMDDENLASLDRFGPIAYGRYEPRTAPRDTTVRTNRLRPLVLEGPDDDERGSGVTEYPRGRGRGSAPVIRLAPAPGPTPYPRTAPGAVVPGTPAPRTPAPAAPAAPGRGPQPTRPAQPAPGAQPAPPEPAPRPTRPEPEPRPTTPDPQRPAPDPGERPRLPEIPAPIPVRPGPKLLGRPVEPISPPARPDTTGARP